MEASTAAGLWQQSLGGSCWAGRTSPEELPCRGTEVTGQRRTNICMVLGISSMHSCKVLGISSMCSHTVYGFSNSSGEASPLLSSLYSFPYKK